MKQPDYELLFLNDQRAHFRFQGKFRGEAVTWDVQIEAIDYVRGEESIQSMRIEKDDSKGLVYAWLNLAVPRVNESEILKSIIMISNYKNLRTGVHKWRG